MCNQMGNEKLALVPLVGWFGVPRGLVILAGWFCFAVGIWHEAAILNNSRLMLGGVLFSIGMSWHYLSDLVNDSEGWRDRLQNFVGCLVFAALAMWLTSLLFATTQS